MEESLIGRFAAAKAGHDAGALYVIIGQSDKYVYLCDGRLRPCDKPKKKSRKHIQLMNLSVPEELCRRMRNQNEEEKVFDHEIKCAIKSAMAGRDPADRKGESQVYVKE